ncbi:hypothetical protein RKE25_22185 (plasmid) [Dyella sp. BiH032]|uniref:hypothetical protein n=1 Tax=Dyella sp. BiH032 TaxID=3075430 RepID=UPI00289377E6|nr:hypothetical protein [Dyella sp. BiH032]WNL48441.1 hypothetical protein RKE25_22185 [Dyella sp. BiH032]
MRFKRRDRFAFSDTPRKRAALERKQRQERESLPLFATQVAAEQESADDVMAARAQSWERAEREGRSRDAADWRRARAKLAGYPVVVANALRAYWKINQWPGTAIYLLSMMHMFDTGRLEAVERMLALPGSQN